ncbi:trehalose-6-phosphate synthase [Streptomyces sp. NPDC127190]|uniref:trehalose-6-phosphate synthase n=1 Tax=unclassified Streptomyces TaxID=2593676 RepID=UPI003629F6F0
MADTPPTAARPRPAVAEPPAPRVLITDLDGTLLGGDDRARRRLHRVLAQHTDITVVFATGRSVPSVRAVLERDPWVPAPRWIVADVGASVADAAGMRHLEDLEDRLRKGWPGADLVRAALRRFPALVYQEGVVQDGRCSFFLPPEHLTAELRAAVAELGCTWTYSADRYFDVLPEGAGKGPAVRALARMLRWPASSLLVAGDTLNDLSLFTLGAHGVIMGNAEPALSAAVPVSDRVHRPALEGAAAILSALERLGWIPGPAPEVVGYHRPPFHWSNGRWRPPASPNGILPTLTSALGPGAEGPRHALWTAAIVTSREPSAPAGPDVAVGAPPEPPGTLPLALLPVSRETWSGYFHGACKETLWPVLMSMPWLVRHDPDQWADFEAVNAAFADHIDDHAAPGATVWLHDYNLWLVPGLLRARRPDLRIGLFHHTPFPAPETFRALPAWEQLRTSLAQLDWAGFHTDAHAGNFRRLLAGAARTPRTGVHPLGIDRQAVERCARRAQPRPDGDGINVLSVERLDYAKAPVHKIRALAALLDREPALRGRLRFRLVCPPPEPGIRAYDGTRTELERAVTALNSRWSTAGWQPVDYIPRSLPFARIVEEYLAADVFWVTSFADGMNLTAQEYVTALAATGRSGVLVLSRHAGVADQLRDAALLTDPASPQDLVDTLHRAVTMTRPERRSHTARLAARLDNPAPADWARAILTEIRQR